MPEPVWVDLLDPSVGALDAVLPDNVHVSALERLVGPPIVTADPRPRLETHGDYLFGVLVIPITFDSTVVHQELGLIVTRDRLVTARKTPAACEPFQADALVAVAHREGWSPGMCLYALFDDIAEHFISQVDAFNTEIDELEDNVEKWKAAEIRQHIGSIRHNILHVRRVLTATRDAARSVLDDRVDLDGEPELFPREVELHFADTYDKLLRATDALDLARDLLSGVRDYHAAQVANSQNEVMKRLTVIASLLLTPTFIVGLYGMNFEHIPELGWHHGYLFAWALIVATTIGQLIWFRRRKWM